MTAHWIPTIQQASTIPNLLNPTLQQAIPSLIRDEIHRLANVRLFQNNFQSSSIPSQLPVSMKFTDDSLHIRIAQNAPWISLLPSSNPMSPEEQTIDMIRKEVMEKVALLWRGVPDSSSNELDREHTNAPGSSNKVRKSTSARTRSKRSTRTQQNEGTSDSRDNSITISKNKIDSSTHTTNNYYCCHSGAQHFLPNVGKAETQTLRRDMHVQTDSIPELVRNSEEIHPPEDSRDNVDSSNDESKQSSSQSFDNTSHMEDKNSTSTSLDDSNIVGSKKTSQVKILLDNFDVDNLESMDTDLEFTKDPSESSQEDSRAEQQPSNKKMKKESFKDPIKKARKNSRKKGHTTPMISQEPPVWIKSRKRKGENCKNPLDTTDSNLEIEDLTEQFRKLQINDPKDSSDASRARSMPEVNVKTDPVPILRRAPSKANDQFVEIKKFIKEYNTESKPVSYLKALLELQDELAQEQPNIAKVNNLVSFLQADSLQLETDMPTMKNHWEPIAPQPEEESFLIETTNHLERIVSVEDQLFTNKIDASVEPDNYQTDEEFELLEKSQEISTRVEQLDRNIFLTTQEPPTTSTTAQTEDYQTDKEIKLQKEVQDLSNKYESLSAKILERSKLETEQNNYIRELQLELNRTNNELVESLSKNRENLDDESTLVRFFEDQLFTNKIDASVETDNYQTAEEFELLEKSQEMSTRVEQLDRNIFLTTQEPPTTSTTAQTEDYQTDKEIKLQKEVQDLSNKYESLSAKILERSKLETEQNNYIRELQLELNRTNNELVDVSRRFETLAGSTETKSAVTEDQDDVRDIQLEEVSKDDISSTLAKSMIIHPAIESDDEQEDLNKLLRKYEEVGKDLLKKQDPQWLREFHAKYANSGIHIELYTLAEYLHNNQDALLPDRAIVLRKRQDLLDRLDSAEKYVESSEHEKSIADSNISTEAESVTKSITNLEEILSTKDISRLHAFIHDSITETDAFLELANNIIDPSIIPLLLANREILIKMQNLLDSDPQLVTGISGIKKLLDQLNRTEDYQTDKEIKLQKEVQDLSNKYENLSAKILERSKLETEQNNYIRELQLELNRTNNELVDMSRRFETLAGSTETKSAVTEDQDDVRDIQLEEVSKDDISSTLAKSMIIHPAIESDDEQEDLNKLFRKYEEVSKDLLKKQDPQWLREFHAKYANSGIHIELYTLAEYLHNNQDALLPDRAIVLRKRQELLDRLDSAEKYVESSEHEKSIADFNISTEAESVTKSITNLEEILSTKDISRLHAFIHDSITETDAFLELANNIIDPSIIPLLLANREILIKMQNLLDSDPQLVTGISGIKKLLDQLNRDVLQLIYKGSNLEISYLNKEDFSDSTSISIESAETVSEDKISENDFIDDEIINQPTLTDPQMNTLTDQDDDELDGLLDSSIFTEQKSNNKTHNTSTQTDTHVTDNEIQLREQLRKLQIILKRTKSTHKDELASLLRVQNQLQSESQEKIQKIVQSSIEDKKNSFSQLQHAHEKYTKLLEDTTIEIANFKESLAEIEAINLAKKVEFDSFRSKVYSPTPEMPKAAKVETQTQATQVNDISIPTNIDVKSSTSKVKPTRATASRLNSSQYDINLKAASMHKLRMKKASLELSIQKNLFPKSQLAKKQALLTQINEELIQRNQKPKSKNLSRQNTKKPLRPTERNRMDLGKEAFLKQQDNLNNKRTNHK